MPTYNPELNCGFTPIFGLTDGVTIDQPVCSSGAAHHARVYRADFLGLWPDATEIMYLTDLSGSALASRIDSSAKVNGGAYRYWIVGFNEDETECGKSGPHFASSINT